VIGAELSGDRNRIMSIARSARRVAVRVLRARSCSWCWDAAASDRHRQIGGWGGGFNGPAGGNYSSNTQPPRCCGRRRRHQLIFGCGNCAKRANPSIFLAQAGGVVRHYWNN